jgi:Protein of unknown function (DUF1812).
MKISKIIQSLLLLPVVLLASCINDNNDDCLSDNLILHFSYDNFPDHINRVNVSVFDLSGVVVGNKQIDKSDLLNSQSTVFALPNGVYTAVCWGNAFDNTKIAVASLTESRVSHPNYNTDAVIATEDSLYFGRLDGIAVKEGIRIEETVNFIPAHITINITINGLTGAALRISNLNELYDFHQNAISPITSTFYPVCRTSGNTTTATTDVYRFTKDTPIIIDVFNGDGVLASVALDEYLSSHPSLVIEDGKECTIDLVIGFAVDHSLTITVNGWEGVSTTPVLPV